MESRNIPKYIYMMKGPIQFKGKTIIFSTKGARTIHKEINEPYPPYTKIKFKCIIDLNMQAKL